MFGNLIYFNKSKIEQYSALMHGRKSDIFSLSNDENDNSVNYLLSCSKFEELLKGRDDFYDFVDGNQEVSINDVKISSIIRVKGEVYVPEQFDMIHLIEEYKTQIMSSVKLNGEKERDLLKTVLNSSKMKIPVYCELDGECDYWMGICKVTPENLMIEYNDLEDYEGTEFTILARLEARKYFKDNPLIVFDIYKDFLGLNRTLRKQILTKKNEPFENISVAEDYLALEILAIY